MLFNSPSFILFLAISSVAYWLGPRKATWQNAVLVLAGASFCAYWSYQSFALVAGVAVLTYWAARANKTWSTALAIMLLLGVLGVFKYFDFFVGSFASAFGVETDVFLRLALPLGISFYTFMAIGYLLDVRWGKVASERNPLVFLPFLLFFPQLAAGPIGRAPSLLPQYRRPRSFDADQAAQGLCLMVYGLFKKMVVADLLAIYVKLVFENPSRYSSTTCLIGALFFTVQIYCDFSGYSDCARGVALLFGIDLIQNFNRPYLAKTFSEFWRNWHVSLSTWFRDYVYIPLGGSRCPLGRTIFNTWVVFLLSGLWHGAAWTFVLWGALHAVFLTCGIIRKRLNLKLPDSRLVVFVCVSVAWIFFRASSWDNAVQYFKALFALDFQFSYYALKAGIGELVFPFGVLATAMLALSYVCPRDCRFSSRLVQAVFIVACCGAIVFMSVPTGGDFIYFRF